MVLLVVYVLILVGCFYMLHRITDTYFIPSLERISLRFRLPSDIAGATLMAMGSSAPELFTSLLALLRGQGVGELGAGTIVGSAVFNVLVIVGLAAFIRPIRLTWQPVLRDLLFYLVTILLLYWALRDGIISLLEASLLLGFYLCYLIALPLWKKIFPYTEQAIEADFHRRPVAGFKLPPWYLLWSVPIDLLCRYTIPNPARFPQLYWVTFAVSIAMITAVSWVLVEVGVHLAVGLGVPLAMIGLTVLAVGSSVPDMLSSVSAARKGRGDMAFSNAIGSNVFDILIGLGAVCLIVMASQGSVSVPIDPSDLQHSVVLLIGTVGLIFALVLITRWQLGRLGGALLISIYVAYVAAVFLDLV